MMIEMCNAWKWSLLIDYCMSYVWSGRNWDEKAKRRNEWTEVYENLEGTIRHILWPGPGPDGGVFVYCISLGLDVGTGWWE